VQPIREGICSTHVLPPARQRAGARVLAGILLAALAIGALPVEALAQAARPTL
jgi:hypothetical protein